MSRWRAALYDSLTGDSSTMLAAELDDLLSQGWVRCPAVDGRGTSAPKSVQQQALHEDSGLGRTEPWYDRLHPRPACSLAGADQHLQFDWLECTQLTQQ